MLTAMKRRETQKKQMKGDKKGGGKARGTLVGLTFGFGRGGREISKVQGCPWGERERELRLAKRVLRLDA